MSLEELIVKELKKGRTLEFKYHNYASVYLKYDNETNTFYTESDDPSFVCDGIIDINIMDFKEDCYLAKFTD